MAYPENIENMIEDFTFLDDWEDRYMHVIEMGKALAPLAEDEQCAANKVNGCVSQVWLISNISSDGKTMSYRGDSDAHIVKGLVAIVINIFSNRTAEEIAKLDVEDILTKLGLSEHLSAQRSNGLMAMIARIQKEAQGFLQS